VRRTRRQPLDALGGRAVAYSSVTVKSTLDFIIIGAQKAGTTSLFEYLRQHPELALPPGKEVPFFSHEGWRARGWEEYIDKTFAFADPHAKWGTATTTYMVGGIYDAGAAPVADGDDCYDERTVPLRIRELLPDVKLVAILRDPIERARSHHQMMSMRGLEERSFNDAISELLRPESIRSSREFPQETTGYITWGEYGRILAGYFDVFPREQILVVFTEELERSPQQLLHRVQEFLGVTADFLPDNVGERYRVGGTGRRLSWLDLHAVQSAARRISVIRALWHALPEATQRRIDLGFRDTVYRFDLWNRHNKSSIDDPSPSTLNQLRAHFTQDTDRLTTLLGAPPPWKTVPGRPAKITSYVDI
jgi:hypothetical protein